MQYDEDGNLKADGVWLYTWDAENRLIAMESAASVARASQRRLEFAYDTQSRRIAKTVYDKGADAKGADSKSGRPTTSLTFIYDGWNLIAEMDGVDATRSPVASYVWGLDLSGSIHGVGGVGGLLGERRLNVDQNASPSLPVYDGNGNVVSMVNGESSSVVHRSEYKPFGDELVVGGYRGYESTFRFSTKYYDLDTEKLYFGYRYYDPVCGRWLNRDPAMEHGGSNMYGCVGNNPIGVIDPDGRNPAVIVVGGGATLGAIEIAAGIMGISAFTCVLNSDCRSLAARITKEIVGDVVSSVGDLVEACRPKRCLPCIPVVGSIAYRVDLIGPDHNGVPTPHSHPYTMHQSPPVVVGGCHCFWVPRKGNPLPGVHSPPIALAAGGGFAP